MRRGARTALQVAGVLFRSASAKLEEYLSVFSSNETSSGQYIYGQLIYEFQSLIRFQRGYSNFPGM